MAIAACNRVDETTAAQNVPDGSLDVAVSLDVLDQHDVTSLDVGEKADRTVDDTAVLMDGQPVDRAPVDTAIDDARVWMDSKPIDAETADAILVDHGHPQCSNPPFLRGLNECSPGTPGCYVMSDEWRLQGSSIRIPETKTCHTPYRDMCGCDLDAGEDGSDKDGSVGSPCPTGETCIVQQMPSDITGPARLVNVCKVLCLKDDDCGQDARCWEGYCAVPECVLDSQCSRDACGHCTQTRVVGHIGEINTLRRSTCVYEGPCGPGSCAGCYSSNAYATAGPTHTCP